MPFVSLTAYINPGKKASQRRPRLSTTLLEVLRRGVRMSLPGQTLLPPYSSSQKETEAPHPGTPGGCPPYLDETPAVQGGVGAARHLRRQPQRAVAVAQPPAAPQAAHLGAAPCRRHRQQQREDGGAAHGRWGWRWGNGDGARPPGHVGAKPGAAPRAPPAGR